MSRGTADIIGIASSISNPAAVFCASTAGAYYDVFRGLDEEEDPLGLLVRSDNSGVDKNKRTSLRRLISEPPPEATMMEPSGPEAASPAAADCCYALNSGDPLEVIDAVLRSSKAVRDRVSSRQNVVLDSYKAESQQLHKELSLLPPTYVQYRAVHERVNSRRRQRTIAANDTTTTSSSVSHPLNFHLNGANAHDPPHHVDGSSRSGPDGAAEEPPGKEQERGLDQDGDREFEEGGAGPDRSRAGLEHVQDGHLSGGGSRLEEGSGDSSAGKEAAEEQTCERGTDRRYSTLARAGSASEMSEARSLQAPRQLQRVIMPGKEEDVPAPRRSKVRGRQMVFSLLEAARIEEGDMEDFLMAFPVSASEEGGRKLREAAVRNLNEARKRNARELDALITEYDPRPSVSRCDHTFDKLRKALPRKINTPNHGGGDGGMHEHPNGFQAVTSENHVGNDEGEQGGQGHEDAASDNGCSTDDRSGGDRKDDTGGGGSGGGGGGSQSPLRAGGHGKDADADKVDYPIGSAQGGENVGGGRARSGGLNNTRSDGVAAAEDGGVEERPPDSSPLTTLTASTGRRAEDNDGNSAAMSSKTKYENAVGGDGPRGGGVGGGDPTKRPVTAGQRKKKPTLPDPNEVNGSVLADAFNMDHIKDLPGLVGGDSRGLSRLVSDTVIYIDPAFPNLEFHRRAAMDRAGYFMPGYKPQVISPGPDAGAYWLERRQSYRVKMGAPPPPSGTSNDSGGKKNQRPRRRSPQRASPKQHRPGVTTATATTASSMPGEAHDRARRRAPSLTRSSGSSITANTITTRPTTTTAKATSRNAPAIRGRSREDFDRERRGR